MLYFDAAFASGMYSCYNELGEKIYQSFALAPLTPLNALVTNVFPVSSAGFPFCFYELSHKRRENDVVL